MWTPDLKTLFLILFLVNVCLTLMLFTFWKTQKTYNGFRTWMLSLLVITSVYFIYIISASVPVLINTVAGDLLIAFSVMMRLDSTRRYFWSRPLPPVVYAALIPAALLFLWFTYQVDSVVMRGVVIGLLIVPCFLYTALTAIQFRDPETRPLRYGFAAALLVTALFWAVVIVRAVITPGDHSLSGPDPINPIFFTVAILMDVVSTVSFMMLNMARSQTEIRQTKERYRNLADNLPDYVLVHDGEIIRYANPAAARLMEPSRQTLAGQPIGTFLTAASAEAFRAFIEGFRSGASPAPLSETAIQLRDGTVRHCLIKTVPIEDKGALAFLSVITDITERKAAEDALSRVNKKLTILSSITRHDIQNQLTALSAYLELSASSLNSVPEAAEFLRKEREITETIGRQIEFTSIYEDMGTTAPVWLNLSASVRRAVAALPIREVKVEVDRKDLSVYGDPLCEKVFYNLIDNAIRYGGPGMTSIRISSHETGQGLVIICEDNGIGVTDADKKHLFNQGFGKNTGLGLFLSRESNNGYHHQRDRGTGKRRTVRDGGPERGVPV